MTTLDEAEHQRLQNAISDAERILGGNPENSMSTIAVGMQPMKQRIDALEKDGVLGADHQERKKSDSATAVAIAALVAQESRLSHSERQTYSDFLRQDYFTRDDFKKLDAFYADSGAWDRLTDEGKKQMSERIWTGVEQGSHSFAELPNNIRKKETDQLADYIKNPEKAPDAVQRMSPEAKQEFIRTYDSGDQGAAQEVLNSEALFGSSQEKTQATSVRRSEAAARDEKTDEGKKEENLTKKATSDVSQSDSNFFAGLTESTSPTSLPESGNSGERGV